jgi:cell division inhibitor SepF
MASLWQKTLYYLGLVDEGEVDLDDAEMQPVEVPPDPSIEVPQPEPGSGPQVRTVNDGRGQAIPGERVEPPAGSRRRMASDRDLAEAGVYVADETAAARAATNIESEIIVASTFSDAQLVADLLQQRVPVVLDLRSTEPEMVRRLVDFASGLTYALDGTMRKVAQGVILVSPAHVTVSQDERRRLAQMGLYEAADVG